MHEKDKDPKKKLTAEELEKRVAPMALTYSDPTTDPPPPTSEPVEDLSNPPSAPSTGGGGSQGGGKTQA